MQDPQPEKKTKEIKRRNNNISETDDQRERKMKRAEQGRSYLVYEPHCID